MTNKKISILIPDLRIGGAERVVVNLANEFVKKNISVDLVLFGKDCEYYSEIDNRVQIVKLDAKRFRFTFLPLIRYINEVKPDALIANMWPLTVIAVIAKIIARIKPILVIVEHTNWQVAKNNYGLIHRGIIRASMRICFPYSDHVVSVSKGASDALSEISFLAKKKVETIYNPIVGSKDVDIFNDISIESWVSGSGKKIISIGSLKAEKNFKLLLNAFSKVLSVQDAKLLILGDGPERANLEKYIATHGLAQYVSMPGFTRNPKKYLVMSDLFVLSSNNEGFGNVIVEALDSGIPVVSTNCQSGPSEILEDGKYGILTPVGDALQLSKAILKSLASIPEREMLKNRAQDFTISLAAAKYLELMFPGEYKTISK